jgi:hypothetical protein
MCVCLLLAGLTLQETLTLAREHRESGSTGSLSTHLSHATRGSLIGTRTLARALTEIASNNSGSLDDVDVEQGAGPAASDASTSSSASSGKYSRRSNSSHSGGSSSGRSSYSSSSGSSSSSHSLELPRSHGGLRSCAALLLSHPLDS